MTHLSFPSTHAWIGFERLFDDLEKSFVNSTRVSYPPYNLKVIDDNKYVIEIACAGFSKDDIDVVLADNVLTITGTKKGDTNVKFLHKGIAERNFERSFTLANDVIVKDVTMINGMLSISLEKIIPEEKRPKKLEIKTSPELLLG